ncbi:WecB/TagA/CpsF family glycosyltransferase [Shewanella algae]|uniref:WecB/TagA/CpsF family glycosyltransferase n=1 Tax=Shewanella algae TaxID=38313 RepID=UPI001AAD3E6A|nr:WecB/TagA/CpsF family glycosyltransferase [Shewanella algae]QTE80936.1 WecB/TagA/CpsF family glycosyltransferase [Shewanella algae]
MSVNFFGIEFKGTEREGVLKFGDGIRFVITVNAEFVVEAQKDSSFRALINSNYATFDGQVPLIIAKCIQFFRRDKSFIEKVSGSDLIFDVMRISSGKKHKVFLLGDNDANNSKAIDVARNSFDVDCKGFSPPFEDFPFSSQTNELIFKRIAEFSPEFLFVAFGAKKQELWIADNLDLLENLGVKWVVGCGGSIAFLSGNVRRAPVIVQKLGGESFFRLFQEPKLFRFKRIFKSFLIFKYVFK